MNFKHGLLVVILLGACASLPVQAVDLYKDDEIVLMGKTVIPQNKKIVISSETLLEVTEDSSLCFLVGSEPESAQDSAEKVLLNVFGKEEYENVFLHSPPFITGKIYDQNGNETAFIPDRATMVRRDHSRANNDVFVCSDLAGSAKNVAKIEFSALQSFIALKVIWHSKSATDMAMRTQAVGTYKDEEVSQSAQSQHHAQLPFPSDWYPSPLFPFQITPLIGEPANLQASEETKIMPRTPLSENGEKAQLCFLLGFRDRSSDLRSGLEVVLEKNFGKEEYENVNLHWPPFIEGLVLDRSNKSFPLTGKRYPFASLISRNPDKDQVSVCSDIEGSATAITEIRFTPLQDFQVLGIYWSERKTL